MISTGGFLSKKVFLKILQYSHTCTRVSFWAATLLKKSLWYRGFPVNSVKFCLHTKWIIPFKIFKDFISSKAKGRISRWRWQENKARQSFQKKDIFHPLIRTRTCAYALYHFRGLFRTQSNISDCLSVDLFCKTLHLKCLTGFWTRLFIYIYIMIYKYTGNIHNSWLIIKTYNHKTGKVFLKTHSQVWDNFWQLKAL